MGRVNHIAAFMTLIVFSINGSNFEVPRVTSSARKAIPQNKFKNNQEEEAEFKNIQSKWSAFNYTHETNKTLDLIPNEWLLPTAQHNVTLNTTQIKNGLMEKVLTFIRRHQIHGEKNHSEFSKLQLTSTKAAPLQYVELKSNLMDKIRNTSRSLSNKRSKNSPKDMEKDKYEYPGQNQTLRLALSELWKIYYECLENNTDFVPEAHYAYPGESIKMMCPACLKPGGETKIAWTFATVRTGNKEQDVDLAHKKTAFSSNNRVAIENGGLSLHIYGVNERDAGNYTCSVFKTMLTVHLLQVADAVENLTRVWVKEKPHPAPTMVLPNFGITVYTKWRNWTSCSRCARVGKRFRVGVCTIGTTKTSKTPAVLSLFRGGVPCRSRLLPKTIQNHPNVISRNSEIMQAFCKEPCLKEKKYVVHNEQGEVVEEADNSKGVYSMLQKLPKLPPPVRRKILFLKQWDTAYIQCPGSLLSDAPTRWFLQNQPIFSKGNRIYVTLSHMLVIEELGLSDSKLYSCWQGSKLVGTVRLVISQPVRLTFSQQISTISMIAIVTTFVIIFSRALCNSLRSTK